MAGVNQEAERAAALEFLFRRIDYERNTALPPRLKGLGLQRMHELVERLGNPHHRLPVVHVAGTKGKGSTASMIASILLQAGYRVGLYTSPHLERLEERFVLNGQICSSADLVALVNAIRPTVDAMDREAWNGLSRQGRPTFFEITTAMAMYYFAQQQVDLAVLEVGMGGRLDSTNVCHPVVAVITSISLDHTRQLGDTEPKIAAEKAGIIKPGIPVVSGATQPEVREVIRAFAQRNAAPIWELNQDFFVEPWLPVTSGPTSTAGSRLTEGMGDPPAVSTPLGAAATVLTAGRYMERPTAERAAGAESGSDLNKLELSKGLPEDVRRVHELPFQLRLLGRHQLANAAVAIAAAKQVARQGWPISSAAIQAGLATAFCPARIELVGSRPHIVVDTAHNVASIQALVEVLRESLTARKRVLVFAATREKDSVGMLRCLLPHFDQVILTRYLNNPRGVPPEELGTIVEQLRAENRAWNRDDPQVTILPDPQAAWLAARAHAQPEDLICITGSLFLAGELRTSIQAEQRAAEQAAAER